VHPRSIPASPPAADIVVDHDHEDDYDFANSYDDDVEQEQLRIRHGFEYIVDYADPPRLPPSHSKKRTAIRQLLTPEPNPASNSRFVVDLAKKMNHHNWN
jgi:hypothetical protein